MRSIASPALSRFADDLEPAFEVVAGAGAGNVVVVDEEHPGRLAHVFTPTVISTSVPAPGELEIVASPPTAAMRSRIERVMP